jgi:hypothetical protein
MELLGDAGHVESRFGPPGDTVCVGAWLAPNISLGSEIILDTPDGTPR